MEITQIIIFNFETDRFAPLDDTSHKEKECTSSALKFLSQIIQISKSFNRLYIDL